MKKYVIILEKEKERDLVFLFCKVIMDYKCKTMDIDDTDTSEGLPDILKFEEEARIGVNND